jgi:hypothetical protein
MAPPPVRLPGEIPAVVYQIVVAATRVVMGCAGRGRTETRVISGKVHALALMTPAPVGLTVGHHHVL